LIKLYTEKGHYTPQNRKYLIDVLRPLLPKNRLVSDGIDQSIVSLTNSPEECHYVVLPMAWNYYLENGLTQDAQQLIKLAEQQKKKILICVRGDYYVPLPESEYILSFYYSAFNSKSKKNTFALPVIVRDPLEYENSTAPEYRPYQKKPQVGFCGHVDSNFGVTITKSIALIFSKYTGKIFNKPNLPDSIIPPTHLRRRVLELVEKSPDIKTNFIKNSRYKGGISKDPKIQAELWNQFKNNITGSDYTLCMRGTGNFSARLYETLAMGRIPIFINTDCILPFSEEINWRNHIVWVEFKELSRLNEFILDFHSKLSEEKFLLLQKSNRQLWEKYFQYSGFYTQFISQIERFI